MRVAQWEWGDSVKRLSPFDSIGPQGFSSCCPASCPDAPVPLAHCDDDDDPHHTSNEVLSLVSVSESELNQFGRACHEEKGKGGGRTFFIGMKCDTLRTAKSADSKPVNEWMWQDGSLTHSHTIYL